MLLSSNPPIPARLSGQAAGREQRSWCSSAPSRCHAPAITSLDKLFNSSASVIDILILKGMGKLSHLCPLYRFQFRQNKQSIQRKRPLAFPLLGDNGLHEFQIRRMSVHGDNHRRRRAAPVTRGRPSIAEQPFINDVDPASGALGKRNSLKASARRGLRGFAEPEQILNRDAAQKTAELETVTPSSLSVT